MSDQTSKAGGDEPGDFLVDMSENLAEGSKWAFVGQIFGRGTKALLEFLLSRFFGSSLYGLYALGWTIVRLLTTVGLLGLHRGIVRFVSMYRNENNYQYVRGVFYGSLGLSTITSIVLVVVVYSLSEYISVRIFGIPELSLVLRILVLILPFFVVVNICAAIAQGYENIKYQQFLFNGTLPVLNVLVVLLAFGLGYSFMGVLYGLVFAGIVSTVLCILLILREYPELRRINNVSFNLPELTKFSVPMFLSSLIYLALSRIDRLFIGVFGSSGDVGVYTISALIASQLVIFSTAGATIFSPIVPGLHNQGQIGRLQETYRMITRWIVIVSIPALVLLAYFSTPILSLFGPEFTVGQSVLLILILGQFARVGVGPSGELLEMTGYQNLILLDNIGVVILNIILNLLLIPVFGIVGAAIATVVSLSALELLVVYQVNRYVGIHPFGSKAVQSLVVGSVLGVSVFSVGLFQIENTLFELITLLILFVAYLVTVWLFLLTQQDKKIIFSFVYLM